MEKKLVQRVLNAYWTCEFRSSANNQQLCKTITNHTNPKNWKSKTYWNTIYIKQWWWLQWNYQSKISHKIIKWLIPNEKKYCIELVPQIYRRRCMIHSPNIIQFDWWIWLAFDISAKVNWIHLSSNWLFILIDSSTRRSYSICLWWIHIIAIMPEVLQQTARFWIHD